MATRIELPDRFCRGIEVPHPMGKGRRYGADPRNPGSVLVENRDHANLFAAALGGYAREVGSTVFMSGPAAAETIVCSCGHERWAWVERCRCEGRS